MNGLLAGAAGFALGGIPKGTAKDALQKITNEFRDSLEASLSGASSCPGISERVQEAPRDDFRIGPYCGPTALRTKFFSGRVYLIVLKSSSLELHGCPNVLVNPLMIP